MKKVLFTLIATIALTFATQASFAAPMPPSGGHGAPMYGGVSMGHPPMGNHSPSMRPPIGGRHDMGRPPMIGGGARPPMIGGGRPLPPPPPMHRPYRPIIRPYYSPFYYSSVYYPRYTTYSYYYPAEYEGVAITPATAGTVVVRDDYAGVNTAANVINTAANVAATIRYLTW